MSQGVNWFKIEDSTDTGKMPTNTGAVTAQFGINAPGGPVEFLQLAYNYTFTAANSPVPLGEMASLITSLRVVLNGEVVHDFQAGFAKSTTVGPSQYGYLINHIGGRSVEEPTDTAEVRKGYINIPLGRQTPAGVNRYEITIGFAPTDTVTGTCAIVSGSQQFWLRMNPNMQTTTTVCPATSFISQAGAYEMVTVRVPQNVPGVVSGLLVLNDTESDEMGQQGLRVEALSQFGIEPTMYRATNGDMENGIMWNKGNSDPDQIQTYASRLSGALMIPTFGLTGGNIIAYIDSTAGTTRRFLPIITNPVGASAKPDTRQSQSVVGNTAKAILDGSLQ